ncbi:MAG: DUF4329 domain-containing protein [Pseudomonadota bacterium]
MILRCLLLCIAALSLVPAASRPSAAQSIEEWQYVQALLRNLNPLSITYNREVCGYILRNPDGRIASTKWNWGTEASCYIGPVPRGVDVLSSWHTHAAWAPNYDSEVPSTVDVESDMAARVNGWVSTPGGRLWFVDGETGFIRQVCGRDCLPSDPNFFPEEHGPVAKTYTLRELRVRFGEF